MSALDVPPTRCITVEHRTFGIAGPRVWNGLPPDVTISLSLSRDQATSSVTVVLPPPGQRCGTVCLNSFGNRTSPSDNSNDH